jgi:hypothetical protein
MASLNQNYLIFFLSCASDLRHPLVSSGKQMATRRTSWCDRPAWGQLGGGDLGEVLAAELFPNWVYLFIRNILWNMGNIRYLYD